MAPPIVARVLSWNSRSAISNKADLRHLLVRHSPSVAAISETWLRPGYHFRIQGYACLRDDRADGRGGAALLLDKSLPFSRVNLSSGSHQFNVVAARIRDITILSIYIPHPSRPIASELRSILTSIPGPYIVLGDFNAHHLSWGSNQGSALGNALVELLDDMNRCLLNDGSPTRVPVPLPNPSAVDHAFCSPSLASLASWTILTQSFGSDHYPILIKFPQLNVNSITIPPLQKYNLNGAEWPDLEIVSEQVWSPPSSGPGQH